MNSVLIKSSEGTEFWVTSDFIKRCRKPGEFDNYHLINEWSLLNYLHKEEGPAIPCTDSYWIDGRNVTKDEHHVWRFKHRLNKLLED